MIYETHTHFDDASFDSDREEAIEKAVSSGVQRFINVASSMSTSRSSVELAEKYPYFLASVGVHPEECADLSESDMDVLAGYAKNENVAAIGEIGLDYYWDKSRKEEQKDLFRKQLSLAVDADLPVIIHDREAHADSFDIVSEYRPLRGVFHCYSGSAEMAAELLKMGWYLGFDGPVTYKNARKVIEVIEICPPERILLETDSPYLSPAPVRGRRNDSSNLGFIAEKIAEIKGLKLEELAGQTSENACRLFGI